MSVELYIWYESLPEAQAQVQAAFAALARAASLATSHAASPRLLKRADRVMRNGKARDTWMEIWPVPVSVDQQVFANQLQSAALEAGFADMALGGRHIEPFEDCSPPSIALAEAGSSRQT